MEVNQVFIYMPKDRLMLAPSTMRNFKTRTKCVGVYLEVSRPTWAILCPVIHDELSLGTFR